MVHEKLLTNTKRCHRSMAFEDLSQRCLSAPKTLMHVVRDCEDVQLL